VLENIRQNVSKNLSPDLKDIVRVEGHEWGLLTTSFASTQQHSFTRILAADCFWMPHQHENLVRSMLHFLSLSPEARVFCIAGFHTGRAKLAAFFDVATDNGLEAVEMYEEDDTGVRRDWAAERDGGRENHTERKKWLVVCRLRRKV